MYRVDKHLTSYLKRGRCERDLNSIDFDLCGVYKWIRCNCDACGCEYHGHS
jgi:hypothetical protein